MLGNRNLDLKKKTKVRLACQCAAAGMKFFPNAIRMSRKKENNNYFFKKDVK